MKQFDKGWWNCFNSFANNCYMTKGDNLSACHEVLNGAGVTIEEAKHETDTGWIRDDKPLVLGWTRDEKGNVTNRHPVEVANAVTSAKRENTQNYVLEQIRKKHPNRGIFWQDGKAYYIRKLTPRECFRLMGVSDMDIDKIQAAGISKSQQYKMAGNSIVVNTLAAIFRQLFIGNFNKVIQTEIF